MINRKTLLKYILSIAAVLLLISFVFIVFMISNQNSHSDRVSERTLKRIQPGMSIDEVFSIIGFEGEDIGSGAIIYRYQMKNGKYVYLLCRNNPNGETIYVYDIRREE